MADVPLCAGWPKGEPSSTTIDRPVARAVVGSGDRAFFVTSALAFIASSALTIVACRAMAGGMPMDGGWTMSMAWMKMAGQTWAEAAAMYMGMWVAMMVAMMMPSLVPMLMRYRVSLRSHDGGSLGQLTATAACGYFFVWTVLGVAAYPIGVAVAAAAMRWPILSRLFPFAIAVVMALAGCVQLTEWKARQLDRCRTSPCHAPISTNARGAFRYGTGLGLHCSACCAGFMVILLVAGVMDLGAMALVAGAITIERLVPRPERASRVTGAIAIAAGVFALARACSAL